MTIFDWFFIFAFQAVVFRIMYLHCFSIVEATQSSTAKIIDEIRSGATQAIALEKKIGEALIAQGKLEASDYVLKNCLNVIESHTAMIAAQANTIKKLNYDLVLKEAKSQTSNVGVAPPEKRTIN